MASDDRAEGIGAEPEKHETLAHPALGTAGNAALAAAGEAAAFLAGAPIAGAADGAIGLGEAAASREAELEDAIAHRHEPAAGKTAAPAGGRGLLLWLVLAVLAAALIWLFRSQFS